MDTGPKIKSWCLALRADVKRSSLPSIPVSQLEGVLLAVASALKDGVSSPAPDVFGGQIIQTFIISPGLVVDHKLFDLPLKFVRQVIVF